MILQDRTLIRARPEAVFRFFEEMETHYLAWHPDHVLFRWERGRGVRRGNVFSLEERIAGKLLRRRVAFTYVIPNQYIGFAPTFWPVRVLLPRMLFRLVPEQGGCWLIAEIHLRMGPRAQRARSEELAAVREHMRVEGENIRRLLEARAHEDTVLSQQDASPT